MKITTQAALRKEFWSENPELTTRAGATQNDYNTDTRVVWIDFVDYMARAGFISQVLASRATL
jgi:hypothetical protein